MEMLDGSFTINLGLIHGSGEATPNSAGNLAAYFALLLVNDIYESGTTEAPFECELQDLAAELRQGIKNFTENKAKRFRGDGAF
ncbi:hypothetical protein L484_027597 [Morus notabilis]|uniref:Uncharacterized protein n=1 Tax=Morus notabilis TaxID=981085 RepID=W9RCH1_9ROSA|nr:hypothetical protein L484_027597 [Morus notabilis]